MSEKSRNWKEKAAGITLAAVTGLGVSACTNGNAAPKQEAPASSPAVMPDTAPKAEDESATPSPAETQDAVKSEFYEKHGALISAMDEMSVEDFNKQSGNSRIMWALAVLGRETKNSEGQLLYPDNDPETGFVNGAFDSLIATQGRPISEFSPYEFPYTENTSGDKIWAQFGHNTTMAFCTRSEKDTGEGTPDRDSITTAKLLSAVVTDKPDDFRVIKNADPLLGKLFESFSNRRSNNGPAVTEGFPSILSSPVFKTTDIKGGMKDIDGTDRPAKRLVVLMEGQPVEFTFAFNEIPEVPVQISSTEEMPAGVWTAVSSKIKNVTVGDS